MNNRNSLEFCVRLILVISLFLSAECLTAQSNPPRAQDDCNCPQFDCDQSKCDEFYRKAKEKSRQDKIEYEKREKELKEEAKQRALKWEKEEEEARKKYREGFAHMIMPDAPASASDNSEDEEEDSEPVQYYVGDEYMQYPSNNIDYNETPEQRKYRQSQENYNQQIQGQREIANGLTDLAVGIGSLIDAKREEKRIAEEKRKQRRAEIDRARKAYEEKIRRQEQRDLDYHNRYIRSFAPNLEILNQDLQTFKYFDRIHRNDLNAAWAFPIKITTISISNCLNNFNCHPKIEITRLADPIELIKDSKGFLAPVWTINGLAEDNAEVEYIGGFLSQEEARNHWERLSNIKSSLLVIKDDPSSSDLTIMNFNVKERNGSLTLPIIQSKIDATKNKSSRNNLIKYRDNVFLKKWESNFRLAKRNNDTTKKIAALKNYIKRLPNEQKAYVELGQAFQSLGENEEAKIAYNKAISLNENSYNAASAQILLGDLAIDEEAFRTAYSNYEEAYKKGANFNVVGEKMAVAAKGFNQNLIFGTIKSPEDLEHVSYKIKLAGTSNTSLNQSGNKFFLLAPTGSLGRKLVVKSKDTRPLRASIVSGESNDLEVRKKQDWIHLSFFGGINYASFANHFVELEDYTLDLESKNSYKGFNFIADDHFKRNHFYGANLDFRISHFIFGAEIGVSRNSYSLTNGDSSISDNNFAQYSGFPLVNQIRGDFLQRNMKFYVGVGRRDAGMIKFLARRSNINFLKYSSANGVSFEPYLFAKTKDYLQFGLAVSYFDVTLEVMGNGKSKLGLLSAQLEWRKNFNKFLGMRLAANLDAADINNLSGILPYGSTTVESEFKVAHFSTGLIINLF